MISVHGTRETIEPNQTKQSSQVSAIPLLLHMWPQDSPAVLVGSSSLKPEACGPAGLPARAPASSRACPAHKTQAKQLLSSPKEQGGRCVATRASATCYLVSRHTLSPQYCRKNDSILSFLQNCPVARPKQADKTIRLLAKLSMLIFFLPWLGRKHRQRHHSPHTQLIFLADCF